MTRDERMPQPEETATAEAGATPEAGPVGRGPEPVGTPEAGPVGRGPGPAGTPEVEPVGEDSEPAGTPEAALVGEDSEPAGTPEAEPVGGTVEAEPVGGTAEADASAPTATPAPSAAAAPEAATSPESAPQAGLSATAPRPAPGVAPTVERPSPDVQLAEEASPLPGAHRGGFSRLPTAPVPVTVETAPAEPGGEFTPDASQWAAPEADTFNRGIAGWALAFAIVGLIVSLFVGWGFPIGLVAVVSAIIALRRPLESRAVAVWAIVLGVVSILYSAGWLLFGALRANFFG